MKMNDIEPSLAQPWLDIRAPGESDGLPRQDAPQRQKGFVALWRTMRRPFSTVSPSSSAYQEQRAVDLLCDSSSIESQPIRLRWP